MKFPTAYEERHAFWYLQFLKEAGQGIDLSIDDVVEVICDRAGVGVKGVRQGDAMGILVQTVQDILQVVEGKSLITVNDNNQ